MSLVFSSFSTRKQKLYGNYEVIESTGQVSPTRSVPESITKPPYVLGLSSITPSYPEIKSEKQIDLMRKSCAIARDVLNYSKGLVQVSLYKLMIYFTIFH